jgi:chemotaxis protein methyltransferase CheR
MSFRTPASLLKQASALIEERTGIAIHGQFYPTLDELLAALSREDTLTYLERLRSSRETDPAWQELIRTLTIGETYFLREQAHFLLLRSRVLPDLIEQRRKQGSLYLNLWSVGCASGEEPYSLAITLCEILPDIDQWTIRLVGTDLNAAALHIARRGVYRKWAFRHTDLDFQVQYFDPTAEGLQIKPRIRELVAFRHANLFNGPPMPQFDIILSRNVLLYFNSTHARRAETLFYDALIPGGWLFMGQAEGIHHQRERWIAHMISGGMVYQKSPLMLNTAHSAAARQPASPAMADDANPARTQPHDRFTYNAALRAIQREDYNEAEQRLRGFLAAKPNHAPAHLLRAYIQASRRQLSEAHATVDTALRLNPLLADAHYLRALLLIEEGKMAEAHKALRATLYSRRDHPLASFMLGNIYAQIGELVRANRLWENTRRAIANLEADSPISDISDITAGQLSALVNEQLRGWQA